MVRVLIVCEATHNVLCAGVKLHITWSELYSVLVCGGSVWHYKCAPVFLQNMCAQSSWYVDTACIECGHNGRTV